LRKFVLLPCRDEHGSGLNGTGSGLKPILARSGLDHTAKLADQGWIGLRNFCSFNVIILKISKILVVIRFHRFAK